MAKLTLHKIVDTLKRYPALIHIGILLLTALSLISFLVPLVPFPLPYFLIFAPLLAVTISRAQESGERSCYLIVSFAVFTIIVWTILFLMPAEPQYLMPLLTFIFPVASGVIVLLIWQSIESVFSSLYEMTSAFPRKDLRPNEPVREFRREQMIAILRLPSIYLCYVVLSIAIILEALLVLHISGIAISSEGHAYLLIVLFAATLAYVNRLFTFSVSASGSKRFTYTILSLFLGSLSIGVLTGKIPIGQIPISDVVVTQRILELSLITAALSVFLGELILRPLTSGIASTLQLSYVIDRMPILAQHAVDSREKFMENAIKLAKEANYEILISTQTFGLHWWGLQGVLETQADKGVKIRIVGPINLGNIPRLIELLSSSRIHVRCNNHIDKTSIKFLLIDKGKKLLLGFPTAKKREGDYPESREGFIFEDPYETKRFRDDFKAVFLDGRKASSAICREFARCFRNFLWKNRREFEDAEIVAEKPKLKSRDDGTDIYVPSMDDKTPLATFNWEPQKKHVVVSVRADGNLKRKIEELLKRFIENCNKIYEEKYEKAIVCDNC